MERRRTIFARCLLALGMAISTGLASAKDVTLRFTVWDGDESLKILRQLCRRFEEENPGIKVKLENFEFTLYHQKMLVTYAGNAAPDVAMMDMGHFQALAKRHALLPLNSFFEKEPGFNIKDYYEPIVDAHSLDGEVYVLPRDIAPMGLVYYNKKMFDEAGLPYPDGSWTWDFHARPELKNKDFLWVCEQLMKKDAKGKIQRWAFATAWPELLARDFLYSTGGKLADDLQHPTKVMWGDEKAIRAYQFASDFMNKLKFMPNSTETTGVMMSTTQQLFASQKIAMFQSGIWEVPNMRRMLKPGSKEFFDWDITLFPAYKDGTRAMPTGGSGYSIVSSTPHPEEAWRLVKFMAGPVGMEAMAKAGIAQPAIRSLALTKDVWLPGPNTPVEQLYPHSRIVTDRAVPFVKFDPTADYWPSVAERLGTGLDLLWNGQDTAKNVLGNSQAIGQERLDTILKEEDLPQFNWVVGVGLGVALVTAILLCIYLPEKHKPYTNREKGESRAAYKFLSPWLIGLIVFTVGPIILSLLMSFADWDMIQPAKFRGMGNYSEAFSEALFWKSLMVTTIYTVFSVPMGIIGSLLLALLLNQKVRGVALFRTMYYIPSLTSLVAASLIWRKVFNPENGLLNALLYGSDGHGWLGATLSQVAGTPGKQVDWLGTPSMALPALILMSIWGVGGGTVILLAGLQNVPQAELEAATLDGAGVWKRFWAVTFPRITPTLFFCLVTGLIGSFQVFTQSLVMTNGGPNDMTRFFMLRIYQVAFESLRMGYASALSWVLFFIILLVTLVQFRAQRKWVYYESEAK